GPAQRARRRSPRAIGYGHGDWVEYGRTRDDPAARGEDPMTTRVGINGFGRIGRNFLRAAYKYGADVEIVGINDLTDNKTLAHLLRYDSVHGRFDHDVRLTERGITIDGREIAISAERNPGDLPWKDLGADVVIESTGIFRSKDKVQPH